MSTNRRVSVVGLGKLGSCLAACLAHKGFLVIGVDVNPEMVNLMNEGRAPVREPGLDSLIEENRRNLVATQDVAYAVHETAITFIVVPTPSEKDGSFSTRYVKQVTQEIGRALSSKESYHLVVLVSTVLPGGTQEGVVSVLEKESGKRCPTHFGVCYDPEFIAVGSVIHDMLNTELVVIGESDVKAGDQLEDFYSHFLDSSPTIVRTNFANAELVKIALNAYVTVKISFANILTELCERLPDGDVDVVTKALGCDPRIGHRYLKGGLGYGGPCFPRDDVAFATLARRLGVYAGLAEATHTYNCTVPDRVAKLAHKYLPREGTVSVVGMAYKPNTTVVEGSQGLQIATSLQCSGAAVCIYDPLATEATRKVLGDNVRYAETLRESVDAADVLVLANPLPEFRTLLPMIENSYRKALVIIDCWRLVPELAELNNVSYVPLGLGAYPSGCEQPTG